MTRRSVSWSVSFAKSSQTEKAMMLSGGETFRLSMVPGVMTRPVHPRVKTETLVVWEAFPSKMGKQISRIESKSSTYLESHQSVKEMIEKGELMGSPRYARRPYPKQRGAVVTCGTKGDTVVICDTKGDTVVTCGTKGDTVVTCGTKGDASSITQAAQLV